MSSHVEAVLAESFREEWGQVVATLIRVTGDWDIAEECAQDAFTKASQRWPLDGIPDRPGAWLTTAARNRATDRLRRRALGEAKLREVAAVAPEPHIGQYAGDDDGIGDDLLRLIFTCCHPALAVQAQVALTLRSLAGLTTAEIAKALLVGEQTMSKRLTRSKQKIKHAGIAYRVPPAHQLPERLPAVLAVLYLLFNEGYSATSGAELIRYDLAAEAIRLGRMLARLMPDEPEAVGLLALMLLHHARRASRTDGDGRLVPLDEQDRDRWDGDEIADGIELLDGALRRGSPGPYQVQGAVAACHAEAKVAAETDWTQIAALYGQLARLAPSPVVELNRAVALGMADGPEAGLAVVDSLTTQPALAGYYLLPATRADFLRRLGRDAQAADAYRDALDLVRTDGERSYLRRRLTEVLPET